MAIDIEFVNSAVSEGNYGAILSKMIFVIIVVVLMFVVALLSIPFFIITCCCKKDKMGSCQKICFYISTLFLISMVAYFIGLVVFIAKIDQSLNDMNCVVARLSSDLLNGYPGLDISFIGLYGI